MFKIALELPLLKNKGFQDLSAIFAQHDVPLYCVGGAVRDNLLSIFSNSIQNINIDNIDLDFAVPVPPQQVIQILQNFDVKIIPVGLEHGTVIVRYKGQNYEITSFRKDIITDGRHAQVSFTDNMLYDAQRRDFTVNALYYDSHGIVYDILGTGIEDLKNNYIRFIGDAHQRIQEDYLRILRYFRFLARFGIHSYNKNLFQEHDYSLKLGKVSKERISQELLKLVTYPFATEILEKFISTTLKTAIFDDLEINLTMLKQSQECDYDATLCLVNLLIDNDADKVKENLKLSNHYKKLHHDFKEYYKHIEQNIKNENWLNLLLVRSKCQEILYKQIIKMMLTKYSQHQDMVKRISEVELPKFKITGKDLIMQGYLPGKELATRLEELKKDMLQNFYQKNFK